ncbi:MAG: GHKL domain-containing protein [Oscillospiraceae bacterium]|nr:GHKL domain-containing protein [Oscillospiraceae bacterium]
MDFLHMLVFFFSSVLIILGIQKLMRAFFEERRASLWLTTSSYLLYGVATTLSYFLLNIPAINMSLTLLTVFIITLTYRSTMKKRLAVCLCIVVFLFTVDIIVAILMGFEMLSITEYAGTRDHFGIMAIGPTMYIISLIFRKFKNVKKDTITSPMFWISAVVFPALSYVLLIMSFLTLPQSIAILFSVTVFGLNALNFYYHDTLAAAYEDKLKSALHTQEKEYYFTQYQLMQDSVERVRSIRHDMKAHLAMTRYYIVNNKAGEATNYLDSLLGGIDENALYSDTGNIAFDSIINFKLKDAIEYGVKLDIKVLVPQDLNIEDSDVVTILGNLLDNALGAVANIEEKMITLDIEFSQGNLLIRMDNTFDGEVKYVDDKHGEEGAIITRKDGDNHGYGLKNIQKSVEKYDGNMDISYENNIFSVSILLYIK